MEHGRRASVLSNDSIPLSARSYNRGTPINTPRMHTSSPTPGTPAGEHEASSSAAVKVFVRVRPFNDNEMAAPDTIPVVRVTQAEPSQITVLDPDQSSRAKELHTFERCFWSVPGTGKGALDSLPGATAAGDVFSRDSSPTMRQGSFSSVAVTGQRLPPHTAISQFCGGTEISAHASQKDVYTAVGQGVLQNAMEGYNGCIFAYGQTGSGKTYTMMGVAHAALDASATRGRSSSTAPRTSGRATPRNGPGVVSPPAGTPPLAPSNNKDDERSMTPETPNEVVIFGHKDSDAHIITEEAGIVPRLCTDVFNELRRRRQADPGISFKVECQYYEVYQERVFDLLNPSQNEELRVRQDPLTGPFVEGLSQHTVSDERQIHHIIVRGNLERHTAATRMNERSSRSHAILTILLTQIRIDQENTATRIVSKLNLVDLAGSERQKSAGTEGVHFREATSINLSLSTLGRVIDSLADRETGGNAKGVAPPYRDSKLTYLLRDSFGGNSKTTMIATISPASASFDETCNTLRYASRAKQIVNTVAINDDPTMRKVRELQGTIERLRKQLIAAQTSKIQPATIEEMEKTIERQATQVSELRTENHLLRQRAETAETQLKALQRGRNGEVKFAAVSGGSNAARSHSGMTVASASSARSGTTDRSHTSRSHYSTSLLGSSRAGVKGRMGRLSPKLSGSAVNDNATLRAMLEEVCTENEELKMQVQSLGGGGARSGSPRSEKDLSRSRSRSRSPNKSFGAEGMVFGRSATQPTAPAAAATHGEEFVSIAGGEPGGSANNFKRSPAQTRFSNRQNPQLQSTRSIATNLTVSAATELEDDRDPLPEEHEESSQRQLLRKIKELREELKSRDSLVEELQVQLKKVATTAASHSSPSRKGPAAPPTLAELRSPGRSSASPPAYGSPGANDRPSPPRAAASPPKAAASPPTKAALPPPSGISPRPATAAEQQRSARGAPSTRFTRSATDATGLRTVTSAGGTTMMKYTHQSDRTEPAAAAATEAPAATAKTPNTARRGAVGGAVEKVRTGAPGTPVSQASNASGRSFERTASAAAADNNAVRRDDYSTKLELHNLRSKLREHDALRERYVQTRDKLTSKENELHKVTDQLERVREDNAVKKIALEEEVAALKLGAKRYADAEAALAAQRGRRDQLDADLVRSLEESQLKLAGFVYEAEKKMHDEIYRAEKRARDTLNEAEGTVAAGRARESEIAHNGAVAAADAVGAAALTQLCDTEEKARAHLVAMRETFVATTRDARDHVVHSAEAHSTALEGTEQQWSSKLADTVAELENKARARSMERAEERKTIAHDRDAARESTADLTTQVEGMEDALERAATQLKTLAAEHDDALEALKARHAIELEVKNDEIAASSEEHQAELKRVKEETDAEWGAKLANTVSSLESQGRERSVERAEERDAIATDRDQAREDTAELSKQVSEAQSAVERVTEQMQQKDKEHNEAVEALKARHAIELEVKNDELEAAELEHQAQMKRVKENADAQWSAKLANTVSSLESQGRDRSVERAEERDAIATDRDEARENTAQLSKEVSEAQSAVESVKQQMQRQETEHGEAIAALKARHAIELEVKNDELEAAELEHQAQMKRVKENADAQWSAKLANTVASLESQGRERSVERAEERDAIATDRDAALENTAELSKQVDEFQQRMAEALASTEESEKQVLAAIDAAADAFAQQLNIISVQMLGTHNDFCEALKETTEAAAAASVREAEANAGAAAIADEAQQRDVATMHKHHAAMRDSLAEFETNARKDVEASAAAQLVTLRELLCSTIKSSSALTIAQASRSWLATKRAATDEVLSSHGEWLQVIAPEMANHARVMSSLRTQEELLRAQLEAAQAVQSHLETTNARERDEHAIAEEKTINDMAELQAKEITDLRLAMVRCEDHHQQEVNELHAEIGDLQARLEEANVTLLEAEVKDIHAQEQQQQQSKGWSFLGALGIGGAQPSSGHASPARGQANNNNNDDPLAATYSPSRSNDNAFRRYASFNAHNGTGGGGSASSSMMASSFEGLKPASNSSGVSPSPSMGLFANSSTTTPRPNDANRHFSASRMRPGGASHSNLKAARSSKHLTNSAPVVPPMDFARTVSSPALRRSPSETAGSSGTALAMARSTGGFSGNSGPASARYLPRVKSNAASRSTGDASGSTPQPKAE